MANETRLIDVNALLALFEEEYRQSTYPYFHIDEIADEILKAHTVDAVPIPVSIGQAIYMNHRPWSNEVQIEPYQVTCIQISQNKKGNWTKKLMAHRLVNGKTVDFARDISFEDVGVTAFFTREDAEAAFAKMDGERKDNETGKIG